MNDMSKFIGDKMSSRYIAEVTGKDHKNVLRDIRDELAIQLDKEGNIINLESHCPYFGLSEYKAGNGEMRPEYLLTELGTIALLGRYSKPLRRQVEKEWFEFKEAATPTLQGEDLIASVEKWLDECTQPEFKEAATPSYQIEDPIARAERWIIEYKQLKLSK